MNLVVRTSVVVSLVALAACDQESLVAPQSKDPTQSVVAASVAHSEVGVVARANGGGQYTILGTPFGDLPARFSFSAIQRADGSAGGRFQHRTEVNGQEIAVWGEVTCVAVDPENGRAWIGGVVTRNRSETIFTGEIHQPGRDVWFRVLDAGTGPDSGDRTTFLGFEGGGGIITSAEYCEEQIWPDDNARTNPLTSGGLQVSPNDAH